jgi:hypothetical protein
MLGQGLCVIAVVLAYLPLFGGDWEFISSWDDAPNYEENDVFKSLVRILFYRF